MPLFLREWTPDYMMKDDMIRVMHIRLIFLRLPLHLWGQRSLSKIASAIGKPVSTNECTAKKLRVSYIRILIEIDVTQKSEDVVIINEVDGRKIVHEVRYERLPTFCAKCQKIGHTCDIQKQPLMKPKAKVWKEKIQPKPIENKGGDNRLAIIDKGKAHIGQEENQ